MLKIIIQLFIISAISFFVYEMIRSLRSGAPFIPMSRKHLRLLIAMSNPHKNDIFYDLGCGDGRSLTMATKEFGVSQAVGYEISLLPFVLALTRVFFSGSNNIKILLSDISTADICDADIIYLFLMPELIKNITPRLAMEAKHGSRIICAAFPIDENSFPQLKLIKKNRFGNTDGYLYIKS